MGGSRGDETYPTGGSGSGGGPGSTAGEGGSGGGADPCTITLVDDLFSPVPGVANRLASGQVLAVRLTPANAVGVFVDDGAQAGTLAGHAQLPALIGCLENGVPFVAEVMDVAGDGGGRIRVRVRRA